MKYSEASYGRVFVVRLEDGDIIHEQIEKLAKEKKISAAAVICVGGADKGSKIVVGPEDGRSKTINPMQFVLSDVHEITGTGTIFPDKDEKPVLHMHAACGRKDLTHTGCVRTGVKVWHVLEVIIFELIGSSAKRLKDETTGFELLIP
jgi:predicted DNA-binding protein with PD1-like motif